MSKKLWELEARENDGSGNNLDPNNDSWGQAGTPLLREPGTALYSGDDPQTTAPNDGPRVYPVHEADASGNPIPLKIEVGTGQLDFIVETVRTESDIPNSYGTNELSAFYGQFITHDMTASAIPVPGVTPAELFPNAPLNSPLDGINRTPGTVVDGVLEQTNGVTHYLDLSAVYGSGTVLPTNTGGTTTVNDVLRKVSTDPVEHAKLLSGVGGLPTFGELLAEHPEAVAAAWGPALGAFGGPNTLVGGDARLAQQPFLAAIQAVWLKEHNYQVDQLASKHATQIASGEISSDDLFNMARVITEAEHQHIIYHDYLGAIIGKENVPQFTGYDPTVNGGVDNVFTTTAFRFGHDQQSNSVVLVNADGSVASALDLGQAFLVTTSQLQAAGGLEQVLRGLQVQKSQEVDGKLVPSLIDNVLGIPGLNLNLGLLDNVRAADHGIGTLNQVRAQLGLEKYTSFAQLTSDPLVQQKLAEYYGHIDNVDPWIGGLLEKHVSGSQLGETFQAIVIGQFETTMAGDRFFYEERLKDFPELLAEIKGSTFAEIVDRNSGTDHSHLDSFQVANRMDGSGKGDVKYGADKAEMLGADLIIGRAGNDCLYGRNGSDTLYGDEGRDYLDGGKGDDFLKCGTGNDEAYGGQGDDKAWGEDGNDLLELASGNDWGNGGAGNDKIYSGAGNDIALGNEGNDRVWGEAGNDEAFGGDGSDEVSGGSGNDKCYGGAGDDCVSGDGGNDLVNGEGGNDHLWGGHGHDVFVFSEGSGRDKVCDFNYKQDKIDLSDLAQFDSLQDVLSAATTKRGVTTINLGDTDGDGYAETIELIGVQKSCLTAQNFILSEPQTLAA
jgi:peroxidase